MKGVKKGAWLLWELPEEGKKSDFFVVNIKDRKKGHYLREVFELNNKKGKKKKKESLWYYWGWSTIESSKRWFKKDGMKVITEEEAKKLLKEGI